MTAQRKMPRWMRRLNPTRAAPTALAAHAFIDRVKRAIERELSTAEAMVRVEPA